MTHPSNPSHHWSTVVLHSGNQQSRRLALARVTEGLTIAAWPWTLTLSRFDSFDGNESRGAHLSLQWVRQLWFYDTNWASKNIPFRQLQLPLASTVTSAGCDSTFVEVCRFYPGTVAFDTPQRVKILVTDEPARRTPSLYILLNFDMSHIMLCGFQYVMYSCSIATFTLYSYWWNVKSVKIGSSPSI